ncbi:MbtH family protein [Streptomyces cyaneofuscatus]|uniref:MbtH family protein n=1 Tax=Streptomyces cyaneofuscatus TaxID=66883 RepID=UPI0033B8D425
MADPFENEGARFRVLRNAQHQYSLWPTFAEVPTGWDVVLDEASRSDCTAYVEERWANMRPKRLTDAMNAV